VSLHHFARSRVHSRCLARYRQEWAFGRRFVPEGALTESWAAAVAAGGGSGRGEVEAGAEHCQDTLVVREALACLPAAQQWLVRELFWGGRSEAELASELGISRRAVNKRKQRALSSLQGHV
jgi:RNA polymerase sigma factor (sigma-70 family)